MAKPKPFKFGPNQEKWLHALETTKRKQTRGKLQSKAGGFCCLGLACITLGVKPETRDDGIYFDGDSRILSDRLRKTMGLYESMGSSRFGTDGRTLTKLNDNARWPFKKIAAHLRENPRAYFSRSA